MVRRRGGKAGNSEPMSTGAKRQATTPVGGVYKDSRRNIHGDEEYDEEEEWTQVTYNKQKSPPTQSGSGSGLRQPNQPDTSHYGASGSGSGLLQLNQPAIANSYAAATSGSTADGSQSIQQRRNSEASNAEMARPKKTLDRVFTTPAPDGSMRDDLTVEIQTMNGRPFKGSLTIEEARDGIFSSSLGLNPAILHGIRYRFSTYPVIKFKLKHQIDIDELHHLEHFTFARHYRLNGEDKTDTFECKLNGIRSGTSKIEESESDPSIRWVKIEWTDYNVNEKQILDWLEMYGEQAGELSEDIHHNSDSDADLLGTGTYSIRMRLRKEIPQLLPMWGKRIRIYYKGVQKLCTNCFGHHIRRNCRSTRVPWIKYCLDFMERNPEIPEEIYGKWWKIVGQEFGEIIPDDNEERQEPRAAPRESDPFEAATRDYASTVAQETSDTGQEKNKSSAKTTSSLSREEEDRLSEYLSLGMSISEARVNYAKEIELAELRHRIRENQRNNQRGAIRNETRTNIGPSTRYQGRGRGGLSFN
jgi:hypothetical protein